MPYYNECDNATAQKTLAPKKMTLSDTLEAQKNITMEQCAIANRIVGILAGGELPAPPAEGQKDLFSRLQYLEELNVTLLGGIKNIADLLGVDVC